MAGKKRSTKKAANSNKSEAKDSEQINESKKDEGDVETTETPANNATPANKRAKRSGVANNDAEETKASDVEDKKQSRKDSEENKEDGKDSTSDSPNASPSNNTQATSKRTSKRTATTNNNAEVPSSPKMLRRERRELPKEDSKTTDNGKTKQSVKEKPQGREYEVEAIMGKRKTKGVDEFLVKWKGYSEKENSWEPKKNLNCQRLLDEFLKSKN